jgi:general secretion pathway protein C
MNKERLGNWIRATRWHDLLEFALLALLAAALAQWTWIALTPRSVADATLPGARESGQASVSVKRHLFGFNTPGESPQPGAPRATSLKLLGVISPGMAGTGRAIFSADRGGRRVASAGEELSAGVVLKEVHADHVVVIRDGAVERVVLDRRAAAAPSRQARRDAAR